MKYPYISRPTTDRDRILSNVIENEVEELNMNDGNMMIIGMFFDDAEEKNWTLHISELESHKIVIIKFASPEDTKNHYSDTFARFTVD